MTSRFLFTVFTLTTLGLGCAQPGPGGDDSGDDGKADQASGHSLRATNQSGLALFQGFNTLFDEGSAPCVKPVDQTTSAPLTVGDLAESYQVVYVKTKTDLSRSVNIDFGLAANLFKIINVNGAFNLVKSFQGSSTSVQFLLAAKQNYSVTNNRPVELLAGLPDPATKRDAYLHRCQNYYVNGIKFEADLFVLITFDAKDEQTSNSIKASLGVTAAIPGGAILGNVDGHLSGALVSTAARSDVSTHVVAVSKGFLLSGTDSSGAIPLGDALTQDTFNKIDAIRTTMAGSLLNDQCRDAGGDGMVCNGVASPGYEKNQLRSASPVGVLLGSYQHATNAPFYHPNPFQQMDDELKQAETFIRGLTAEQIKMQTIYDTEIGAFWNGSAAQKAAFNLAPPLSPVVNITDIQTTVAPWHDAFMPDDGAGHVGTATAKLSDAVTACWEQGADTDFTACRLGVDPTTTPEYVDAESQISDYASNGRVRPLHFAKTANAIASGNAASTCAGFNLDGNSFQLPTAPDAELLSMVISSTPLPAPSDSTQRQTVWINDHYCGNSVSGFQSRVGTGVWTWNCPGGSLPVLCVPTTGAFGTVPDPGSL